MSKNLTYKIADSKFEVKQIEDDFVQIEGLASTFGNIDRDGDIIAKGAFKNTLINPDIKVKLLNQHDIRTPIGAIDQAIETDEGLFIKARMPKANSIVKDMFPLLQMGVLGDFSIGFNTLDAEVTPDGNRIIKEIELFEVSIVTIPANPKARITSVKSDEDIIGIEDVEGITTKREYEQMLINTKSFTNKAAVSLASCFYEGKNQRDSDDSETKQRDSVLTKEALGELDKFKQLLNGV